MAGRVIYVTLGTMTLLVAGLYGFNSVEDNKWATMGIVSAIAGLGFMGAAVAFALGEVAASRRPLMPPPPYQPPGPAAAAGQAPYGAQATYPSSYSAPPAPQTYGQPYGEPVQ